MNSAVCDNRNLTVSMPPDSIAMDVVDNDSPMFDAYVYCLEFCLYMMDSVADDMAIKSVDSIEEVMPFLPESYETIH